MPSDSVRFKPNTPVRPPKTWEDGFHAGVLVALAVIYDHGYETAAEEIVAAVGGPGLLRVAKREDDMCLKDLRKTIRFVNQKYKAVRRG